MNWDINNFPSVEDLETKDILRQCSIAHRYLAELKGASQVIPNQSILINTLSLQEGKDSSAIENIITTHDDLFKGDLFPEIPNVAAKEVHDYAKALRIGYEKLQDNNLITNNHLITIQEIIEKNRAGFRTTLGTSLKNDATGEIIYTPPQHNDQIINLMTTLERFINDDNFYSIDPLIKMAIMHHQFESIHPFYNGNGRTGRILNVLYLVKSGLLNIPVLYLSRHLIRTKSDYYRYLQSVRETGNWEPWILYMLTAIEKTARFTLKQVNAIKLALTDYKHRIRSMHPKMYSQDLINNLFNHPYTKIEFIMNDLNISRVTATKYLQALTDDGFINKHKIGRSNYYINNSLYSILTIEVDY